MICAGRHQPLRRASFTCASSAAAIVQNVAAPTSGVRLSCANDIERSDV